jgi:hypothetical protein
MPMPSDRVSRGCCYDFSSWCPLLRQRGYSPPTALWLMFSGSRGHHDGERTRPVKFMSSLAASVRVRIALSFEVTRGKPTMLVGDLRGPGRRSCSDRRSNHDRSRRGWCQLLADSLSRSAHDTARMRIVCWASCPSPIRISCGASCATRNAASDGWEDTRVGEQ